MAKNIENWIAFFSDLQAYIEDHGHLPDKHSRRESWAVVESKVPSKENQGWQG